MEHTNLTSKQMIIYNDIISKEKDFHIICGILGTGKSFLTRYITYQLVFLKKSVILTAITGAIAMRLSPSQLNNPLPIQANKLLTIILVIYSKNI